jgi:hypothetical protein
MTISATTSPRRLRPTANEAGVTEDRPYLAVELVPMLPDPTNVVLVGRATTVPFTSVVTGPERTPTDNVKVVATCAVCHLTRWRPRPIWLWEQGVAA